MNSPLLSYYSNRKCFQIFQNYCPIHKTKNIYQRSAVGRSSQLSNRVSCIKCTFVVLGNFSFFDRLEDRHILPFRFFRASEPCFLILLSRVIEILPVSKLWLDGSLKSRLDLLWTWEAGPTGTYFFTVKSSVQQPLLRSFRQQLSIEIIINNNIMGWRMQEIEGEYREEEEMQGLGMEQPDLKGNFENVRFGMLPEFSYLYQIISISNQLILLKSSEVIINISCMNAKLLALSLFPNPTLLGIPISGMLTYPETNDTTKLRKQLVQYILSIGQQLTLKFSTVSSAFDLTLKYLSVGSQTVNKQLLTLTCLFISSKLYEVQGVSLTLIHKLSDHSYTSKQILQLESQILTTLKYNLLSGCNLNTYVQTLFSVISQLIPEVLENTHREFLETTVRIQKLLMRQAPLAEGRVFGPAIIVAALVIMSRSEGRFPVLCRLAALAGVSEEQILQGSQRVLKSVLGKELYRSLRAE